MKNMQPIFILPENTEKIEGKNVQKNNILIAQEVANAVRSTLGPKGMDSMIVNNLGDITITNDGVTILNEMQVEHPVAKLLVEIARMQENSVGDGTTTTILIASEILKKSEELIKNGLHPTFITKGLHIAEQFVQEKLIEIAKDVSLEDYDILKKIASTAITGKGAENNNEIISNICVEAINSVSDYKNGKTFINLDNIKIESKEGESISKSRLVKGIILGKEKVHSSMPERIDNAKILLLSCPLEVKKTIFDSHIEIKDPYDIDKYLEQEERMIQEKVKGIKDVGANVVFCDQNIDDSSINFFVQEGIFAVKRVKKEDMEMLSKATKAKILSNTKNIKETDIGKAGSVCEEIVNKEHLIFVENCTNPKSVTLFVRAITKHLAEELKRSITDALGDLATALNDGKVVTGAGSTEMRLSIELLNYAETIISKEQYILKAFAEALEIIPKTLAENAGLDSLEILTKLRNKHKKEKCWFGVNVFDGVIQDALEMGVIEPLRTKSKAISSAGEVSEMILRIDNVIIGNPKQSQKQSPYDQVPQQFSNYM
ncbi:MAG: thermosome subunit beta [archaeon]|nr:thermosome subunit beta [archaeon]